MRFCTSRNRARSTPMKPGSASARAAVPVALRIGRTPRAPLTLMVAGVTLRRRGGWPGRARLASSAWVKLRPVAAAPMPRRGGVSGDAGERAGVVDAAGAACVGVAGEGAVPGTEPPGIAGTDGTDGLEGSPGSGVGSGDNGSGGGGRVGGDGTDDGGVVSAPTTLVTAWVVRSSRLVTGASGPA